MERPAQPKPTATVASGRCSTTQRSGCREVFSLEPAISAIPLVELALRHDVEIFRHPDYAFVDSWNTLLRRLWKKGGQTRLRFSSFCDDDLLAGAHLS